MTHMDVIAGDRAWAAECADAIEWLGSMPDDSVDLLFTSPPYERARTYGIASKMVAGQEWVDWMVEVVKAAAPKVKGLIAIVCEGQTRNYRYSCVPFLLMADLHRAGFNLRKPPVFHRVGIPGSGGPDWLRNDYETIVCATRPGRLPWSDNTACGHKPKWAPGGEFSHRVSDGARVNQCGGRMGNETSTATRRRNGERQKPGRPSHFIANGKGITGGKGQRIRTAEGQPRFDHKNFRHKEDPNTDPGGHARDICAIANPGNVIRCIVGGGRMGHDLAHENEAPFPLSLADCFVKSFCPPGGIAIDPFLGSGTVIHSAVQNGRRALGCDVRQSQIDLTVRRMESLPGAMGVAP